MELQAASLVCMANVCVHQAGQPRWEIVNFPADRWFHVTYEGSEHYNSARLISDDDDAPGGPITLARSNGAYATRGDVGGREPSASSFASTTRAAGPSFFRRSPAPAVVQKAAHKTLGLNKRMKVKRLSVAGNVLTSHPHSDSPSRILCLLCTSRSAT